MKLEYSLTPYTKINSKWIRDLNIRLDTIKLLQENIEEYLNGWGYGDDFLDITPKARPVEEIIDKLEFIKIKNFWSVKDTVKKMRR